MSPLPALALLIEFLSIASPPDGRRREIDDADDDETGDATLQVLLNSLEIANRLTGNSPGSLGLHPAVYFYNERGKYSRFLFLAICMLVTEKIRNNDSGFFKKFTCARQALESFLVENKSLIGFSSRI